MGTHTQSLQTFTGTVPKLEHRKAIKLPSEEKTNKNWLNIVPLGFTVLFAKINDLDRSLAYSF